MWQVSVVLQAGTPLSSINTNDRHNTTVILLIVTLKHLSPNIKALHVEISKNKWTSQLFISVCKLTLFGSSQLFHTIKIHSTKEYG
jgi:hypothetical protein